ncbi:MAG: MBL fold metallo-hydrolase [Lachnospiraceae bacterium]|jgi:ribonuclease BN (tRNA processing enzyme)|nr:MBL fold metallo-hydrolase [Lachnospiraceae bacterium]
MTITFLSAKDYSDPSKNNGDCIIVDNGRDLVIYDCGCKEHAKQVEKYMKKHNYSKIDIVLSHNDSDHFDGIPYLVDQGLVNNVYTLLLLKYKDELLDIIDDKRRTRESIEKSIEEIYDNIYSLSGRVKLRDMFTDTNVANNISIIGPDKDYALNAVAKKIDSREGDTIDKETIVNAVSAQLSVVIGYRKKLLLTGDSSYTAIEDTIKTHSVIQLPHHGKLEQAESIFDAKEKSTIYYVSDNTGDSNGGSDDLRKKHPRGHIIYNTIDGNQICTESTLAISRPFGSYFNGR